MPVVNWKLGSLLIALAFGTLSLTGCGVSSSGGTATSRDGAYSSEAGYDVSQLADFRIALDRWNTGTYHYRLVALARAGKTRCGLGYSAAFPDLVLLTVINTDGRWLQASIDPQTGVKPETITDGPDYNTAFGVSNQNPEDFFASAEPCAVERHGMIHLAAG
jgi:hypothetical protein